MGFAGCVKFLKWCQVFNQHSKMKIQSLMKRKTAEFQTQAVLKLVGKSGNFISTPSAQQLFQNILLTGTSICFFFRLYSS